MSTYNQVRGGGFRFSICSVGGNWEWSVVADNIQNVSQFYSVSDIRTPFGSLSTVDIPIPSEVILAMADSLSQFQQQLQPLILITNSPSFPVTVTEGDPVYSAGNITFTNAGAFGSFMTVTASPDSPWIIVDPPVVSGINKNGFGSVGVKINPAIMLNSNTPYSGNVNLQDNANNIVTVPVTVDVLPRPAIGILPATVSLDFYLSTMTPGAAVPVDISNTGPVGSLLTFSLAKVLNQSPWLSVVPMNGSAIPSSGFVTTVFSLISSTVPGIPGTYNETVRVSAYGASNNPQDIPITLTVHA